MTTVAELSEKDKSSFSKIANNLSRKNKVDSKSLLDLCSGKSVLREFPKVMFIPINISHPASVLPFDDVLCGFQLHILIILIGNINRYL
jgi:hypothetical protein